MNDLPGARRYFELAVRLEPNHPGALLNLGLACKAEGDFAGAVGHLTRTIELDPLNVEALLALGSVEIPLGSVDTGFRRFARAVELEPESPRVRAELGAALLGAKRLADGEEQLRLAIQLDPLTRMTPPTTWHGRWPRRPTVLFVNRRRRLSSRSLSATRCLLGIRSIPAIWIHWPPHTPPPGNTRTP